MDKTALRTAAEKYGTPLYLFDLEAFTARAQRVRAAFGSDVNLCYSCLLYTSPSPRDA